jgi:nucleoside-diphosphate-sugar epimerase
MRILVTGGTGVLGRAAIPLLRAAGHEVDAPSRSGLDLFDPAAVARAARGSDAILHLATRIPPPDLVDDREAWRENDRLRTEASRLLVDAALAAGTATYVQPTITFVYPAGGPVDEETSIGEVTDVLRSALDAEAETARFAAEGRRGVVLRFGLLDGPGTGNDGPNPMFGATLHTDDAGRALVAALSVDSGVYNVCRDGGHVASERFKAAAGWWAER